MEQSQELLIIGLSGKSSTVEIEFYKLRSLVVSEHEKLKRNSGSLDEMSFPVDQFEVDTEVAVFEHWILNGLGQSQFVLVCFLFEETTKYNILFPDTFFPPFFILGLTPPFVQKVVQDAAGRLQFESQLGGLSGQGAEQTKFFEVEILNSLKKSLRKLVMSIFFFFDEVLGILLSLLRIFYLFVLLGLAFEVLTVHLGVVSPFGLGECESVKLQRLDLAGQDSGLVEFEREVAHYN